MVRCLKCKNKQKMVRCLLKCKNKQKRLDVY